ncbi:MAG TPA: VOC family protein [Acidimicrobiales bacterium]|nr:VOC family protein [Acidimicrobiales bacterium]
MTTRESCPSGAPCWADLWTTDVDGSRRFYSQLFGWEAGDPSPERGGYWMFHRDGRPAAGGMGSMGEMTADNTWKPYFCTRDIGATLARAEARGGAVLAGAMPVANLGVQAVVRDPSGAVFGLWQPVSFEGFSVLGEHGHPSWFELHTSDHAGEVAFYEDVLGWELDRDADADDFRYFTFHSAGSPEELGGVMDSARWLAPGGDHWEIYWHVDDAVDAADRVRKLGGLVTQGPDDTPYGVLVACSDPAGAKFKLRASS